jgi:hypothetical protein
LSGLFVGHYWFILADLGQVSPTTYANSGEYLTPSDFSLPVSHQPINNVLLNTSLSQLVYSSIASSNGSEIAAVFRAACLNRTVEPDSRFRRIYLCTERELKQPINLLVPVFAQGFSLIAIFNALGIFIMSKLPHTMEYLAAEPALELVVRGAGERDVARA